MSEGGADEYRRRVAFNLKLPKLKVLKKKIKEDEIAAEEMQKKNKMDIARLARERMAREAEFEKDTRVSFPNNKGQLRVDLHVAANDISSAISTNNITPKRTRSRDDSTTPTAASASNLTPRAKAKNIAPKRTRETYDSSSGGSGNTSTTTTYKKRAKRKAGEQVMSLDDILATDPDFANTELGQSMESIRTYSITKQNRSGLYVNRLRHNHSTNEPEDITVMEGEPESTDSLWRASCSQIVSQLDTYKEIWKSLK